MEQRGQSEEFVESLNIFTYAIAGIGLLICIFVVGGMILNLVGYSNDSEDYCLLLTILFVAMVFFIGFIIRIRQKKRRLRQRNR